MVRSGLSDSCVVRAVAVVVTDCYKELLSDVGNADYGRCVTHH